MASSSGVLVLVVLGRSSACFSPFPWGPLRDLLVRVLCCDDSLIL
jgi:hypothetical protein